MKGQSLTDADKRYILENKELKFNNQLAVELGVCQATVRRFIQKSEK